MHRDRAEDWLSPASARRPQISFLRFLYTFLISLPLHYTVISGRLVVDASRQAGIIGPIKSVDGAFYAFFMPRASQS